MADVTIPGNHWNILKRSTNCYVPHVVDAAAQHNISNTQLRDAGRMINLDDFSVQVVGRIMQLKPVTHGKADQCLQAYSALRKDIVTLPDPAAFTIVAAVFAIPRLSDLMAAENLDVSSLATASGVSEGAITFAISRGRVSAGIVHALRMAISGAPPLASFCTSRASPSLGKGKLPDDCPFTLVDLLLPLPDPKPSTWP